MQELKKSQNKKKQVPPPNQILKNTFKDFDQYIDQINNKITKRIQTQKGQLLLAYKTHLLKVQRQLIVLRQKNQAHQKKYSSSQVITYLTKQTALFRQQAMRLSNQLEDVKDEKQTYKRKAQLINSQYKQFLKKYQNLIKINKNLLTQNQNLKKLVQQQTNKIQKNNIINNQQLIQYQIQNKTPKQSARKSLNKTKNQTWNQTKLWIKTPKSQMERYFLNQKSKLCQSYQQKTPRMSYRKTHSRSSAECYLKTQQSHKNSNNKLSKNQIQKSQLKDQQIIDNFKFCIDKARERINNNSLDNSVERNKKAEEFLFDDGAISYVTNLITDKIRLQIPVTWLSSEIMSKLNNLIDDSLQTPKMIKHKKKAPLRVLKMKQKPFNSKGNLISIKDS